MGKIYPDYLSTAQLDVTFADENDIYITKDAHIEFMKKYLKVRCSAVNCL